MRSVIRLARAFLTQIRLHEEIVDFANWINPWTDEQRMRDWVAEKVTLIIQELWPKVHVRIYGSFHTNLYLPSRCVSPSRASVSDA